MLYTSQQIQKIKEYHFAYIIVKEENHVLHLTLNRSHVKNAFNEILLKELAFSLSYAHFNNNIWVVVIDALGDVFCAGADLRSFMGQKDETSGSTVPEPSGEIIIGDLFAHLHKPCIAKVNAPVFAGGFLLLCGCNYVVASDAAAFGLPEVKRGIWPMQVMASLLTIMPARKALDLCMMGRTLTAHEAHEAGIVTHLTTREKLHDTTENIINHLCEHSPSAIRLGLKAYDEMRSKKAEELHPFLHSMLMEVVKTKDAMEGIKAFKEKRKPNWKGE
jgi:enoyl-CoA hydratase/carnithine racemase